MKKNIIYVFFLTLSATLSGQVTEIVPMNFLRSEYPENGVYFKDINNELDYFVGIWEGVINNKKYIFHISKFSQILETDLTDLNYYYTDVIKMKFKVIDLSNNQILYDDTSINDINNYKISGLVVRGGTFWFKYLDVQNCYNEIMFEIHKINNQPNKLKYCYFSYYEYSSILACPYQNQEDIPMFLPKVDLVLEKL